MSKKAVFICEDHQIVVDGLKSILAGTDKFSPITSFQTGEDLQKALEKSVPDLLILDLNLPGISGIDLLAEIRKKYENLPVLILTMHSDPYLVKKVIDLGANGYLLKDFGEDDLINALEVVLTDGFYQSPSVKILAEKNSELHTLHLTEREKEIIIFSANGMSSNEMADKLYLSPHTINTHRRNIYKKLGINNIKELIKFAYDEGLV